MEDHASDTSTATMDYDAAADRIGASLGEDLIGRQEDPRETPGLEPPASPQATAPASEPSQPATPAQTYEVPKSWKQEMHEHWGKVTPEAQAYIIQREKQLLDGFQTFRPIQDALAPHQDFLTRSNLPPAQAVSLLLNAQRRLTEGTVEQRLEAYRELGKNLQLLDKLTPPTDPQAPTDPVLQTLQQKIDAIERQANAERDYKISQIRAENQKIVNAFADDTTAHPHFDEVANEISILVSQGYSLQDAYDTAVRMNPVTAEKERARLLTEAEAKWKENARLTSLPKRRAAGVNIKSEGDGREPTEPVGSIEDTIRSVHKQIRGRA